MAATAAAGAGFIVLDVAPEIQVPNFAVTLYVPGATFENVVED